MKLTSIDIETTGLDPHLNNVLEIGMVLHDTEVPNEFHELRILHKFDSSRLRISSGVESVGNNQKLIDDIINGNWNKDHIQSDLVISTMLQFLFAHGWITESESVFGINKSKLNLVGKNLAIFDLPFLDRWFDFSHRVKYRHRIIDPAVLYLDVITDSVVPDLNTCLIRSGITKPEGVTHTAVDDAKLTLQLLLNKLQR